MRESSVSWTCVVSSGFCRGVWWGHLGGVGLLALVPAGFLSVLFGGLVLAAVLASLCSSKIPLRNRTRLAGGVASG